MFDCCLIITLSDGGTHFQIIRSDPMMKRSEKESVEKRISKFYKYRDNRNTFHTVWNFVAEGQLKNTVKLLNKRYNKIRRDRLLKIRG